MGTLRSLYASLAQGAVLPNQKFFEPNDKFLTWFTQYAGQRLVYDVGAGLGHVAQALAARGLKVKALDLHYRERPHYDVEIANGVDYPYAPGSIVLVCRPCHNGMAEFVFSQALARGAEPLLVGWKNRQDHGYYKATMLLARVGGNCENLFAITED